MEKKIITKEQEMFVDKCPNCQNEITGFSEKQVEQRMKLHMTGCKLKTGVEDKSREAKDNE